MTLPEEGDMKKNIIFLDVDGVLNGHKGSEMIGRVLGVDDDKLLRLKTITDAMDADIVLSSTWREFWDPELKNDGVNNWLGTSKKRYGRYLNLRFTDAGLEIIDKTDDIDWFRRSEEIITYLITHEEIENFLILDDEDFKWMEHGLSDNWVSTGVGDIHLCHFGDGIKDKHVSDALRRYERGSLKRKPKYVIR